MDSSSSSPPSSSLPELPPAYAAAITLIDEAHAQDPNKTIPSSSSSAKEEGVESEAIPYELHYARKMTRWLALRCPEGASPALQVACRAQHFQRWAMPRASFPATRAGYLSWRAKQKTQAAAQVKQLLLSSSSTSTESSIPEPEVDRIAALISKQGLTTGDEETQALEDVACLVFLDDQFDGFEKKADLDEDKIVRILQKTWAKMSPRGREMALGMKHSERATALLGKALEGGN